MILVKGKFYSVNGHPGMIFWKNDKRNRYKAVVTGTSEGRHKTRLKYPTEKKVETIAIEVKDLPGPVAAIVNPVVEKFTGTTEKEYVFTNGVDADGNKTADRIIPGGRDANVQAAGIAEATATANADGGYTMKIKFVAESSNFDGTQNTSEPEFHKGAMDPLNLGGLDLGPIKIAEAGLDYPGATVEATVDSQGRLIKLVQLLPLGGFGTGKAGPIKATINLEGSMDATYEITYA